ncbi:hypothetical protein CYR40_14990 [Chimaeribacter arupi]|uniref:RHS repeat-associated core domain-containing protein n=1 Tax=Chimaeribacter arupi TaxID=2060066 RepID=UPI000C7E1B68|nr:RHS repeat-associated core domain-containing protein [Chimaeribacter arupi]PLR44649.1 hypothetical protein CYR40_14990 [Chimaeribacter arupi]
MTLSLTGVDNHGSTLFSLSARTLAAFAYSPFGATRPRTGEQAALPGFNGERSDPLTGVTHLGNGYRAFSPALFRFTCPDSASPFGEGGINAYAYCENDPVNMTDPSGHGPITQLIRQSLRLGVRLGLNDATAGGMTSAMSRAGLGTLENVLEVSAQVATGLASAAVQQRNPQQAKKLMWAALGLGMGIGARQSVALGGALRKGFHRLVNRGPSNGIRLDFWLMGADSNLETMNVDLGITDNFRSRGEHALLAHGNKDGNLMFFFDGVESRDPATGKIKKEFIPSRQYRDFAGVYSAAKARQVFGQPNASTLYIAPDTDAHLYLICCYSKRYAQEWANRFGRPMIACSRHLSFLYFNPFASVPVEEPNFTVLTAYRKHDPRRLIFGRYHKAKFKLFTPNMAYL